MIALLLAAALVGDPTLPQPDPCYALDRHGVAYRPDACPFGGVYWPIPKKDASSDYRRGYCAGFNAAVGQTEVNAERFRALLAAAPEVDKKGVMRYNEAWELGALGINLYVVLPAIPCDAKTGRTDDDE